MEDTNEALGKDCALEMTRRSWKRPTFEPNDIQDLRSHVSDITLLNSFIGSLTAVTRQHVAKLLTQQHQEILDWLTPVGVRKEKANGYSIRPSTKSGPRGPSSCSSVPASRGQERLP